MENTGTGLVILGFLVLVFGVVCYLIYRKEKKDEERKQRVEQMRKAFARANTRRRTAPAPKRSTWNPNPVKKLKLPRRHSTSSGSSGDSVLPIIIASSYTTDSSSSWSGGGGSFDSGSSSSSSFD